MSFHLVDGETNLFSRVTSAVGESRLLSWHIVSQIVDFQHRRLKCDRQQPCQTCVDRGLSLSCSYTRNTVGPKSDQKSHNEQNVHSRIDQLEKLVTSLLGNENCTATFRPNKSYSPDPQTAGGDLSADSAFGTPDQVKLGEDGTRYAYSGHWMSILDGVCHNAVLF